RSPAQHLSGKQCVTSDGDPCDGSRQPVLAGGEADGRESSGSGRMNLLTIAWKSIRQRLLASSLTALSIALGVALMVTVLVINAVVARMFSQSATGYHLIIGAKGSPMQLVLNTIYFMD